MDLIKTLILVRDCSAGTAGSRVVLGGTDLQDLFDSSFKQEESRSWVHVDFGTWHEFFGGDVTLKSNIRSQINVDFGT